MAAHLVQHHHRAPCPPLGAQVVQLAGQLLEHDAVQAFAVFAQRGVGQVAGDCVGHPVAHAFAARLVVQPHHSQAGMLQHVQQVFEPARLAFVHVFAMVRKHARHGGLRVGAARHDVAKPDQVAFFGQGLELRVGVAPVSAK